MTLTMPKPRILIVDDNPVNIKILGESLRSDYEIVVATSGAKALQIAARQPLDLILLDILMPEMDGYMVCRQLKAESHSKTIPVIFITALTDADDELKGLELGAVDYIAKPFQLPIVKARVKSHLELKRKYDLLENMVLLDGLTEIANRRHFDEVLAMEWRRHQRSSTPLSIIMIDIDFFKSYNDNYGHAAGDDCLRIVAQTLKNSLKRPGDLVARYGGEEFVVILPETDAEAAAYLAEKLKKNIADLKIVHTHSAAADHITISLGTATIIPAHNSDPLQLVEIADKMLYEAKNGGRNQIRSNLL